MLDIVIGNQTFTYVNSAKIDDKCYIAYSDGTTVFISGFHYENNIMIIEEIDDETLAEVKEILA